MVSYVSVVNRTKEEVPSNFIKEVSELFLRSSISDGEKKYDGTLSVTIVLVTDDEMRKFNKTYRNKDVTTDVLSFCASEDNISVNSTDNVDEEETGLGDMLISLEEVKKNAIRFGIAVEEELARVVVHGLLHLLGYDHEEDLGGNKDGDEMLKLQERFIDQLFKEGFIK